MHKAQEHAHALVDIFKVIKNRVRFGGFAGFIKIIYPEKNGGDFTSSVSCKEKLLGKTLMSGNTYKMRYSV